MIGTSTSNPNEGVIAGFNGLLAHSIDNFLTVREDSNWKHNIVDGHHRNSITIATSDSSTILTSTDLFKTYQTFNAKHYVTNANRLFLFSPFIADDSTAFVKASDYDSLTKQLTNFVPYSTNTGTTWSKLSNVPNLLKDESNSGFKYFFRHKRDFRIVVSKYKLPSIETYVFHTTDGGVTWVDETPRSVLQQFDDLNAPGNIVFTSDSSGIITGRNKSTDKDSAGFSFLITRDNGATWKRHFVKDDPEISKYYTNYYENALNVYGINDSLFVANFSIVTGDVTYYSTDYGSTWNRLFFKKNEFCLYNSINFFSVDFAQNGAVLFAGNDYTIAYWKLDKTTSVDTVYFQPMYKARVYPQPSSDIVHIVVPNCINENDVTVSDALGKTILLPVEKQFSSSGCTYVLHTSSLCNGQYYFSGKGIVSTPFVIAR